MPKKSKTIEVAEPVKAPEASVEAVKAVETPEHTVNFFEPDMGLIERLAKANGQRDLAAARVFGFETINDALQSALRKNHILFVAVVDGEPMAAVGVIPEPQNGPKTKTASVWAVFSEKITSIPRIVVEKSKEVVDALFYPQPPYEGMPEYTPLRPAYDVLKIAVNPENATNVRFAEFLGFTKTEETLDLDLWIDNDGEKPPYLVRLKHSIYAKINPNRKVEPKPKVNPADELMANYVERMSRKEI